IFPFYRKQKRNYSRGNNPLLKDHGVIFPYQLPLTSLRLDCPVTVQDLKNRNNAVILELK
ncbi:MAG: hypothetical protein ACOC5S_06015, partial [Acidobacteriota bacterium]